MDLVYIISQVFVAISYIVLGIGLRREKRMDILICSNIYFFFLILSYLMLGALSGVISCGVSFFRNFIYMYDEQHNRPTPKYICFLFVIITIVLTIIFYKNLIDIFPCVLTTITIFTVGSRSTKINRFGSLFGSVCWIIYAFAYKSWFVIVCEAYLAICTINGLLKYNFKNNN